jgi:hypothetical protein
MSIPPSQASSVVPVEDSVPSLVESLVDEVDDDVDVVVVVGPVLGAVGSVVLGDVELETPSVVDDDEPVDVPPPSFASGTDRQAEAARTVVENARRRTTLV